MGKKTELLRIQHSTAARYCYKNESNVTRLVATENIGNKYSLWESLLLQKSHTFLAQINKKKQPWSELFASNQNNWTRKVDLYLMND